MKKITDISRDMLMECQEISLLEIWKIQVDDEWHGKYSYRCPVCKSIPCVYKEYDDD